VTLLLLSPSLSLSQKVAEGANLGESSDRGAPLTKGGKQLLKRPRLLYIRKSQLGIRASPGARRPL
jgi:hypothetical protein